MTFPRRVRIYSAKDDEFVDRKVFFGKFATYIPKGDTVTYIAQPDGSCIKRITSTRNVVKTDAWLRLDEECALHVDGLRAYTR